MGLLRAGPGRAPGCWASRSPQRAWRFRVGYLPEHPYLYDYLTAAEYLDYVGRLFGMPAARRRERARELLALVGLERSADLPLRRFSKGMVQRVGLAQALINDPELVILDEPMSGLDPIGRRLVRDLILDLQEAGKTVFFSTHILSDAETLCDRVGRPARRAAGQGRGARRAPAARRRAHGGAASAGPRRRTLPGLGPARRSAVGERLAPRGGRRRRSAGRSPRSRRRAAASSPCSPSGSRSRTTSSTRWARRRGGGAAWGEGLSRVCRGRRQHLPRDRARARPLQPRLLRDPDDALGPPARASSRSARTRRSSRTSASPPWTSSGP